MNLHQRSGITAELTGRGDYIQPSIQSIILRNTLPALRSNDELGGVVDNAAEACIIRLSRDEQRRAYRINAGPPSTERVTEELSERER